MLIFVTSTGQNNDLTIGVFDLVYVKMSQQYSSCQLCFELCTVASSISVSHLCKVLPVVNEAMFHEVWGLWVMELGHAGV